MPTPDVAIAHGHHHPAGMRADRPRRRSSWRGGAASKLTIVHKANVLKLTTGLFRDVCREVAEDYPDVAVDDFHIDAMTVHLVRAPTGST